MRILIRANALKAHLQTASKLRSRAELQGIYFTQDYMWSGDGRVMMRSPKQGAFIKTDAGSVLIKFDQFTMPAGVETAIVDTDTGCVYLTKSSYVSVDQLPDNLHLYAARIAKISVVTIPYPDVSKLSHVRGAVTDVSVLSARLDKIHKVSRALAGSTKVVDLSFQKGRAGTFLATIRHGFVTCEMFIKAE